MVGLVRQVAPPVDALTAAPLARAGDACCPRLRCFTSVIYRRSWGSDMAFLRPSVGSD